MGDCMDWTPTGPVRGIKRRADGTMVLESQHTPYEDDYIPGSWPRTPEETRYFYSPEELQEPVMPSYYLTQAKRFCNSLTVCFIHTTGTFNNVFQRIHVPDFDPLQPIIYTKESINNIVRRVRQTQLQPARPARARRSPTPPPQLPTPQKTPQNTPSPITNPTLVYFGPKATVGRVVLPPTVAPAESVHLASPFPELHPHTAAIDTTESSPGAQLLNELDLAVDSDSSSASDDIAVLSARGTPISELSSFVPSEFYPTPSSRATTPPAPARATPTKQKIPSNTPKSSLHSVEFTSRVTRRLQKELDRQRDSKLYRIEPLPASWDVTVAEALKKGHGNYSASDFVRVIPHSGSRGTDAWLNDEVINGYLKLVCDHGNKDDRPAQTPSYHAFSSFFMSNLMDERKGVASVKKWATRAKIGSKALLQVEHLFIPINSGAHWTLLVVSPKQKNITYYNSLSGSGMHYIKHVKEWLKAELPKDFDENLWTYRAAGESPQQTNSSDCGVFTITSAKHIMLGLEVMDYGASHIPTQRKRIVAELVNGKLIKNKA